MDHKKIIESMQTSRVRNYIIPGLNSYLLDNGKVRMFDSTRQYSGTVTPHTHRFDFACYVLNGEVGNRIYTQVSPFEHEESAKWNDSDEFTVRTIGRDINEAFGKYEKNIVADEMAVSFTSEITRYRKGDWYSMTSDQFHSIEFDRDTQVIFFEGPEVNKHSKVLLPFMHGETIETMECDKDWMYLEDE